MKIQRLAITAAAIAFIGGNVSAAPRLAWSNGMTMEQALVSEATPAFIYFLGKDNMQVVYWDNVDPGSTTVLDWDGQEGIRALAHHYSKMYVDGNAPIPIDYVGEKLINPDGEQYDIGQLHNEWMPSAGLRYSIERGARAPQERGIYVITTDEYAASHSRLPIVSLGTDEEGQSSPLPRNVIASLEKQYGLIADRSSKVASIGDRYTYGIMQFKPAGGKVIGLDVLIDGSKGVYSVAHEGTFDPDNMSVWNVDDGGEFFPCQPLAAFADANGLELCFVRYAPESCTVGVMRLYDEAFTRDDQAIYYVNIDEGRAKPLWKKDLAAMERIYQASDAELSDVTFNHWAYVDVDGDGIDEIWLRDAEEEYGAFFSLRDAEPVLICKEDCHFKASLYKGSICVSGPAGGPSYYYEDYVISNSRVEHCFTLLTVEDKVEGAGYDGVEIDEARAKELRATLPQEPLDEFLTWQYKQW